MQIVIGRLRRLNLLLVKELRVWRCVPRVCSIRRTTRPGGYTTAAAPKRPAPFSASLPPKRNAAGATRNQALAALLFVYKQVLDRDMPRPRFHGC